MGSPHPILVTGGAGFIGSHLVERLLDGGASVVVVDDLSTGRRENLSAAASKHDGRLRLIESTVSAALDSPHLRALDGIVHLAAAVGVRKVVEQPASSIETNMLETFAVLRLAQREGTPLLLASSSEVYGKSARLPFSEQDDCVFGPTSAMRWSYGCAKALDEWLGFAAWHERRLPVVVARIFNTVGPRQAGRWGMVLPRFVSAALAGRPLEIHGDGMQSRCFADVRDVVQALDALRTLPSAVGKAFNVGSDEPITIRALAERVVRQLGSKSALVQLPYETAFGPGFEDLRARQPDLSRIREAIGFRTTIPLDRTITDLAASITAGVMREDAA